MKNNKEIVLRVAIFLVIVVLFIRLAYLQIVEGKKFRKMAEENAAKTVPAPAPRGIILDRNGIPLVVNRPVFSIQILPHLLPEEKKETVIRELTKLLNEKIEFKFSVSQPVVLKDNVHPQAIMRLLERQQELEGVVAMVRSARHYPFGRLASHVLGFVGEIGAEELKRLMGEGYRMGDLLGKEGVEKYYDKLVRGIDGGKKIEVDVYGKPRRLLEDLDPIPGADVKLTIDLELQKAAEAALGEREGAVVVLDPRTGEILAMVSRPAFDPNRVWTALSSSRHPFMNRALSAYPSGSTFKVVTLTAALEEGLTSPKEIFYCPGYYRILNRVAKCWKAGGHGRIDLAEGLVQSCDVVFYELGRRLGPDRLAEYARRYGLGERSGIDLPQEKKGIVPTRSWKETLYHEPWYEGDSINYGIGQGFLQVTPLQMAVLYGTLAVGKRMKPFVVKEIRSHDGKVLYEGNPEEVDSAPLSAENLELIRKALTQVVERGTGIAAKVEGMPAAGKTGTAENPGKPHAWFVCYAPNDNPKYVISVFVAHGEHGDRVAAYIAREILNYFLTKNIISDKISKPWQT